MIPNRLISIFLILCLTFTQTAQAFTRAWLPHQPTQNSNGKHQAAVSLINNKGDLGQTLNDLGSSQNVKSLVTAMVTAGALQGLNTSLNIGNTSMGSINAQQPFFDQLQKNLIDNVASATINTAINGGSLESNLANSLKTAFIDTGAAQGANGIGDLYQNGKINDFTHILAHAIAGCAAGAARSGDCSSGALGAAVGELSAQLYGGARLNSSNLDIPALQTDTVNFARMMAGIAVALTGGDANAINLAANAGGNAAQNNYLNHNQVIAKLTELAAAKDEKAKAAIIQKYDALSQANNDAGYKDLAQGGVMAGYQMAQDKAGLTAMLTGPTNCANDFACQVEVNKNLSEIQTAIQGHDPVGTIGSVVIPLMTGNVLSVAGGAAMELLGLGVGNSSTVANSEFLYYKQQAQILDVSTSENTAVFYSGSGNRLLAEQFAQENGRTILEMTKGGGWLDAQKLFSPDSPLTPSQATQVWSILSERYAAGASGNAVGFTQGARAGSIFNTVEFPALLKNPNVINVITGGH